MENKMREINKKENKTDEQKKDFWFGVLLLYIVVCFLITAIGREKKFLTYSQLSLVYSPMLVIFIVWQIRRYRSPNRDEKLTFGRMAASVGMCSVILALTILLNIGKAFGIVG